MPSEGSEAVCVAKSADPRPVYSGPLYIVNRVRE